MIEAFGVDVYKEDTLEIVHGNMKMQLNGRVQYSGARPVILISEGRSR